MKSSGKNYENHMATIMSWASEDKEKMEKGKKVRNYDEDNINSL